MDEERIMKLVFSGDHFGVIFEMKGDFKSQDQTTAVLSVLKEMCSKLNELIKDGGIPKSTEMSFLDQAIEAIRGSDNATKH